MRATCCKGACKDVWRIILLSVFTPLYTLLSSLVIRVREEHLHVALEEKRKQKIRRWDRRVWKAKEEIRLIGLFVETYKRKKKVKRKAVAVA